MMDAYKCDGCRAFYPGEPMFKITRGIPAFELGESTDGYDLCSWGCVEHLAVVKGMKEPT